METALCAQTHEVGLVRSIADFDGDENRVETGTKTVGWGAASENWSYL